MYRRTDAKLYAKLTQTYFFTLRNAGISHSSSCRVFLFSSESWAFFISRAVLRIVFLGWSATALLSAGSAAASIIFNFFKPASSGTTLKPTGVKGSSKGVSSSLFSVGAGSFFTAGFFFALAGLLFAFFFSIFKLPLSYFYILHFWKCQK